MYSRIIDVNLKTDKLNEIRATLNNEILPVIKNQPGFIDLIDGLDATSGHFICQTFWKDKESVERYTNNVYPTFQPKLEKFLTAEPKSYILEIETSTVHQISRGKAA
ncbi:MAG TPA: hypothetical protein VM009_00620 [Terriglobales bacterium]|nr:hypothetical protein [Terriglobales bacterium]